MSLAYELPAYEPDVADRGIVGLPAYGAPGAGRAGAGRAGATVRRRRAAVRPPDVHARCAPAGVTVLHAPPHEPNPVRLTRRGVVVLAALVGVLGAALFAVAALCAPSSASSVPTGPAVVTVHPGDTLWSIASSAAPGADPAAEIATISRLNGLHGVSLVPGQQLRVR